MNYRTVKCGDYTVHKDMGYYTEKVCHVEPYNPPTEEEIFYTIDGFALTDHKGVMLITKAITNLLKEK